METLLGLDALQELLWLRAPVEGFGIGCLDQLSVNARNLASSCGTEAEPGIAQRHEPGPGTRLQAWGPAPHSEAEPDLVVRRGRGRPPHDARKKCRDESRHGRPGGLRHIRGRSRTWWSGADVVVRPTVRVRANARSRDCGGKTRWARLVDLAHRPASETHLQILRRGKTPSNPRLNAGFRAGDPIPMPG